VDWIPGGSHVEITCFATTDLSRRKVVRPATAQEGSNESGRSASPAVWAGDTLYLSGLSGVAPGVGKEPVDVQSQVRRMASGHMEVLRAAGLELKDIVSGHVYLRDIKDYDAMNKVYREYFSQGPGVRTCLMPNSGYEKNETRVMASFIAARTKTAKN
jgi:enamine deaminase RidA (YjgF/YER057c/UK114 family)